MIDGLWLALRAAGFILLLQASGTVLFRAWFAPELGAPAARELRAFALRLTLAALAVVIAQGLLEPARLAGGWEGIADPALRHLALASPGGVVLWLRFMGLGTLALALWRAHPGLALPAALVALGSFLVSGHTLVDPHRVLLLPLLGLHVGAAAFWFGALASLRRLLQPLPAAAYLALLQRFSVRALWLVPLLALAGVLLAATLLPDWGALLRPYGLLLLAKAALFGVLMGLAALNRLRIVPALGRGEPRAAAILRVTLGAEYALVMLVLAVTALMTGSFSPGSG
jgi:putative copper export protein